MANEMVCTNCGFKGKQKLITKGSILIEIVLWLFLIVPGLVYSIWRHTSRYKACPKCEASNMIPVDSPFAKKLLSEEP